MKKSATYVISAKRPLCDLSRNLNFDIFFRTYIFKKIECRINKINRASGNYNEFNVE